MRSLRALLLAALLPGCASHAAPTMPVSPGSAEGAVAEDAVGGAAAALAGAAATITPQDVHRRVAFLASDELRGRDTPSPGLEKAAEYVAGELAALGLEPAGDSGTFIQRWPYRDARIESTDVTFTAQGTGGPDAPAYGREFFVFPTSQSTASAPLVWAGTAAPGRQGPGPAAAGKALAFYVPGVRPEGGWLSAAGAAIQSSIAANARAVLLVLDASFEADAFAALTAQAAESPPVPITIIGLRHDAARSIFAHGMKELDLLISAGNGLVPVANSTITVRVAQKSSMARPPNVVALLRGSDPALRDTYVVFSAHMDHVGVGVADANGDSIYNGADDDASGTAAIIEVAEAFASLPVRPARSLIFLGVSGEEKGLFGSQHFARNPPVPADRIVANINIDMVGRNAPDTIVGIGQEYTSLGRTVQQVAREHPELGLVVAPDLWPQEQLFVRSDHFSFAQIGVPAIFFTSGLHAQYHEPSDQVELIDTDKLARVARLIFYLGHAVASRPQAPSWTPQGRAVLRAYGGG